MPRQVVLVANDVIVEALLPKGEAAPNAGGFFVSLGIVGLERVHDLAERALAGGNRHPVQMLGEKEVAERAKGVQLLDPAQRAAQEIDVCLCPKDRPPSRDDLCDQDDRVGDIVPAEGHLFSSSVPT
jgi:hypothetical protein